MFYILPCHMIEVCVLKKFKPISVNLTEEINKKKHRLSGNIGLNIVNFMTIKRNLLIRVIAKAI